ncbi:hypothetical protein ALO41_200179 [Pseudomonas amygdali pv. ulmi]|uniref:Transposase n=1 Tax=Pseudomonas amygdali pv. ulmi TaxID=251720 RepID=A0A0Q0CVP3_PSEA0|nr:hypothetical protein [Pseudomonas amygdali]KPZ17806.1 hypothetical protein ALO41_200179 [Pseudomonas amygdali pv. ulmi]KWS11046.1 hypothetical protein AL065_06060 [Pseudomonas amygdali pv. ulmi]
MAGYFEYEKEDLDLQVPVLFSLRELRAIELLLGGDTFEAGSDWAVVAERAQDKLSEEIIIRRLEAEKNLKSTE